MSSDRKIVLHIGLHKTGTTAIQNVLYANRDFLLAEEGVLYPSLAPNLSGPLLTSFKKNSQKLMASKVAGLTEEEAAARRKSYLDSLDAEISSREWETLLLSAESASFLSAPEVAKLREWGEKYSSRWTVLVCVRHPVSWTRSVVQQRLRQGDTLRQLYEELPTPQYRLKISRVASVFGRENVRVFDFDAAVKSEGGIVGAFAGQAGLSASSRDLLASRTVRVNESLSLEAARLLDSLNRRRPLFVGDARAPRRAGPGRELAYLRRIEGRKFDVPDPVKENARSRSREDVAWLNETFGLDLYPDVADSVARPDSNKEPVEASGDPAFDGIAEVFGELVTENLFRRVLDRGKAALARGDLERAAGMFREAARLDPDASRPKRLLARVAAKQPTNTGKPGSRKKVEERANRGSLLSRLWR